MYNLPATPAALFGAGASAWRRGDPALPSQTSGLNWAYIYEIAKAVFDRARYFYFPDSDHRARATILIMSVTSSIREYAILDAADIAPAWDELRNEAVVVDLIMATTADLVMETGVTVDILANELAKAVHAIVPRGADGKVRTEGCVYDSAFLESVGTPEELASVLKLNPWLLTLLILRRTGRVNLVRPQSTESNDEART